MFSDNSILLKKYTNTILLKAPTNTIEFAKKK